MAKLIATFPQFTVLSVGDAYIDMKAEFSSLLLKRNRRNNKSAE